VTGFEGSGSDFDGLTATPETTTLLLLSDAGGGSLAEGAGIGLLKEALEVQVTEAVTD